MSRFCLVSLGRSPVMAVNSLWSPGSGRCRYLKVAGEAYSARSRLAHLVIWSARGVGPVRLGSILLKTAADRLSVVPLRINFRSRYFCIGNLVRGVENLVWGPS